MFHGVDSPRRSLACHALRVAVTDGVELGPGVHLPNERIVLWHASVVLEADDAARRVAHVLRAVGLAPLARSDEEVAIGEQQARAEVAAAVVARQGDVDLLDILQARADEPAAGDRGGRIVIVVGARIGEVDQAVLREAGVQHHVEQPALAIVPHLGHARDRLGHEPAVRDDAEPAGALRHQHPPVGQEGEDPRGAPARPPP